MKRLSLRLFSIGCLTWGLTLGLVPISLRSTAQPLPVSLPLPQAPGNILTEVTLYFGLPTGKLSVAQAQWQAFLDHELTPRFKDGLTVLDAYGQYLNRLGKLSKDKTKVVILLYESTPQKEQDLQTIITRYKKAFHQESVLRTTRYVRAEF